MIKCILLLLYFTTSHAQKRKMSLFINPGCPDCDPDKVLVHVTADGENDTLHHIWDFTYKPTVILSLTPLNTSLSINWTQFKKGEAGSMKFSSQPLSFFSYIVNELIEFNDINNTAIYDPTKFNKSDAEIYDTHHFHWKLNKNEMKNTSDLSAIFMEGKDHHKLSQGHVLLKLSAFGTLDHAVSKPHLLHTVNASQIDIILHDLPTHKHFKSRFALGIIIASNDSTVSLSERKSLDDEHSPGVFDIGELETNVGYLMWRSVAYTSSEKLMTSSTVVKPALYHLANNNSFNHTAISSLFGPELNKDMITSSIFSFGQAGSDDVYSATRYLSWTFLGGLGEPVDDSYSLIVQLLTIVGIGLPIALLLLGLTCIVVKRIGNRTHDIVFAES